MSKQRELSHKSSKGSKCTGRYLGTSNKVQIKAIIFQKPVKSSTHPGLVKDKLFSVITFSSVRI